LPLHLGRKSAPEPDLAVVPGTPRDYAEHPITALLLVEVSDTSLAFDRRRKGTLYAKAGILDYWIINLVDRRLEVYRSPAKRANGRGFAYADKLFLSANESIAPLAAPHAPIAVAELLP